MGEMCLLIHFVCQECFGKGIAAFSVCGGSVDGKAYGLLFLGIWLGLGTWGGLPMLAGQGFGGFLWVLQGGVMLFLAAH